MVVREDIAKAACQLPSPKQTREKLILHHLPQVKLIARQISERLPISVTFDDLVSAGTVGLIAAIDRYDPAQRVQLRTYAEYKIRGAILDSLRTLDWAPRQQRRRGRLIERAILTLERKMHRAPNEEEIASELSLPVEQYQEWLSAAHHLAIASLEAIGGEEDGRSLIRYLAASGDPSPAEMMEQSQLESLLAESIELLPELEKVILNLYYFEEMTLREVAGVVDLHESRISQLKSQAILRIRCLMRRR